MSDYKFNYIITIYDNDLIERVISGVLGCAGSNSYIYLVLDGHSDGTETIIDRLIVHHSDKKITKLFVPDVDEISAINLALLQIPQDNKGFNIILQGDVLLTDSKTEEKIAAIYNDIGYKNIGTLTFRYGANIVLNKRQSKLGEMDLIESVYGTGMATEVLLDNFLVERMVSIGIPGCVSFEVVKKIGIMDDKFAPHTYENHDLSLRCLLVGYRNLVFALPFELLIKRDDKGVDNDQDYRAILSKNCHYLFNKYYNFLTNYIGTEDFDKLWLAKPFRLDDSLFASSGAGLKTTYLNKRKKLIKSLLQRLYIDYFKLRIKKLLLSYLRLNKYKPYKQLMRLISTFKGNKASAWQKIKNKFFRRVSKQSGDQGNVRGTTDKEIAILKKYAGMAKVGIIEIGVLDGGTTKEMSEYASAPIYGIDPIIVDSMDNGLIGNEEKIRINMAGYDKFDFYKDYSYNVVKNWNKKFDFLWIDGDHTYEGVRRDFNDWFPLLEKGGYLAFHDSTVRTSTPYSFSGWSGPKRLVREIRNLEEIDFIETADSISVFKKLG